jgi:hypothetical protein
MLVINYKAHKMDAFWCNDVHVGFVKIGKLIQTLLVETNTWTDRKAEGHAYTKELQACISFIK